MNGSSNYNSKKQSKLTAAAALSAAFVLVLAAIMPTMTAPASASTAVVGIKLDTGKVSKEICIKADAEKTIVIGGTLGALLDENDGVKDGQFKVSLQKGDVLCLTLIADAEVVAKLKVEGDCGCNN